MKLVLFLKKKCCHPFSLPCPKKANEYEDYRPLNLMSHITKLLLGVIQERIYKKIDDEVRQTQFGFCKESCTREGILVSISLHRNMWM